jgi:hypothetical protein
VRRRGGERARERRDLATEGERAVDGDAGDLVGGDLPDGGEDRHGGGQRQGRGAAAQPRGRDVEGDAALGEGAAAVLDGGAHGLAQVACGDVGEPEERERGKSRADVAFDGHAMGRDPVKDVCAAASKHRVVGSWRQR